MDPETKKLLKACDDETLWMSAKTERNGWNLISVNLEMGRKLEDFKVSCNKDCNKSIDKVNHRRSTHCSDEYLWSSKKVENQWKNVSISLNAKYEDFKLILEGSIPANSPNAQICVDNITTYTEPCSALEPKSVVLQPYDSMARYFVLTFVGALLLGLIIPSVILVLLIIICRRRHRRSYPGYANSKLFNTNLWYYIGGNDHMFDDSGNGRCRGSTPGRNTNGFLSSTTDDFMDLPDVVVPGGRVMNHNSMGTMRPTSATMGRPGKAMGLGAQGAMVPAGMVSSGFSMADSNSTQNLGTLTMGRNQNGSQGPWVDFQQPQQMFQALAGQQPMMIFPTSTVAGVQSSMPMMVSGTQNQMLQHQSSMPLMTMAGGQPVVGLGQHPNSMGQMLTPQTAPMMFVQSANQQAVFHPLNQQQMSETQRVDQTLNQQNAPVTFSQEQIQRMAQNGTLSVHIGTALAAANSAPGGPSMTLTTQDALDLLQSVTNNAGTLRGLDTLVSLGTSERPPPAYNEGPVLPPRKPASQSSPTEVKTSEANPDNLSPTGMRLAGKYGLPVAEI